MRTFSFPILLSSLLLVTISLSALNTQVPIWLETAHYTNISIGIIGSFYFAGNLVGTIIANRLISLFKARYAFCYVCLLFAISVVGMSLSFNLISWAFWRFLIGIACSVTWVIVESCILVTSKVSNRTKMLAIYMTVYYLGSVLGQFLLNFFPKEMLYFSLVIFCLLTIGGLMIFLTHYRLPLRKKKSFSIIPLLKYPPSQMGLIGCVIAGIILGAFYSLLPAYYTRLGSDNSETANIMMLLIISGMIAQMPVTRLVKVIGRLPMLMTEMTLAIVASVMLYLHVLPILGLILLGISVYTLYPIAMAWACESVKKDMLVTMNQTILLVNSVGSLSAPFIISGIMQFFGDQSLFLCFIVVFLFYGYLLFRESQKR